MPAAKSFREFSRSFVRAAGLLREAPYDPRLTLMESRVLFELAEACRAKELGERLFVDKGYLSRVLAGLRDRGLLREAPGADGRERRLRLTAAGRRLFRRIDRVSDERARALLTRVDPLIRPDLEEHLKEARARLVPREALHPGRIWLRDLRSGDLGWVIERHGALYRREYGWNLDFEILVAEIAAGFAKSRGPGERAWIAEADGVRLGCVFLARQDRTTAKLRILLVDPVARGLGIGSRLVGECVRFARRSGYRRIILWTNGVLASARRIYKAQGFILERKQRHRSFGKTLEGQYWAKVL